jgi:hypothetical protein
MLAAITRSNWGSPMSVFTVQILLPMPLAAQKAPTSHCELRRLLNQRHGTIPKLHSQPEQLMPVLTFTARLLKARHCWGVCSLRADSMYTCHAATPSILFFLKVTGGAHPPPAGHTQTAGQSLTAGGRRQSLTNEGRLTHPIPGGAQRLDQKKRGA